MTDADRATLANVLRELEEAGRHLDNGNLAVRMTLWYCEGRIRGLLAEPIPAREGE